MAAEMVDVCDTGRAASGLQPRYVDRLLQCRLQPVSQSLSFIGTLLTDCEKNQDASEASTGSTWLIAIQDLVACRLCPWVLKKCTWGSV